MEQPTEGLMFEELDNWRRLIADGDWAVKAYWGDFNDGFLNVFQNVTPDRIRAFMAYLVRLIDGEPNPVP